MLKRRATPLLLIALVGVGGWTLWRQAGSEPHSTTPVLAARWEKRPKPGAPLPRIVEFLTPERYAAAATKAPAVLSPDAAALTNETIALQLLAADTELELNARQWTALATATLKIQAIRQAYEASIARITAQAPGQTRMEIPTYAVAGDALREEFHAELRAQLGEANAAEVLAQLGRKLEGHFGGFGVSVQTIDIASDPARGGDVITRTVQYWNSVEGQNRLTTRRETHFPDRDDPTGETWRPLLALIRG